MYLVLSLHFKEDTGPEDPSTCYDFLADILYTEVEFVVNKTMADEDEIVYTTPATACDEKKKDGFIRVIVAIKNLKTSTDIVRRGLLPKAVKKASNAKVNTTFDNQSFCLTVNGEKGDLKGKHFKLDIRKLPYEIDPDKSYNEIDEDRVLLFLCKKQNKSWYPELDNGLETAEDEEGEQTDGQTQ